MPAAMTVAEAVKRYPGATVELIQGMLRKGRRLERIYGNAPPPAKELSTALYGRRVGKYWFVPVQELQRIFGV